MYCETIDIFSNCNYSYVELSDFEYKGNNK